MKDFENCVYFEYQQGKCYIEMIHLCLLFKSMSNF